MVFLMSGIVQPIALPGNNSLPSLIQPLLPHHVRQSKARGWCGARESGLRDASRAAASSFMTVEIFSIALGSSIETMIGTAPPDTRQVSMPMPEIRFGRGARPFAARLPAGVGASAAKGSDRSSPTRPPDLAPLIRKATDPKSRPPPNRRLVLFDNGDLLAVRQGRHYPPELGKLCLLFVVLLAQRRQFSRFLFGLF